MKKTITTAAVGLVLSLSSAAAPAHAEAADSPAPRCTVLLAESQHREALLHYEIDAYKKATEVVTEDLRRAEREIARQRATIKRLRAQLAASN